MGVAALVGFGVSAPKLLPVMDTMSNVPRLIESREALDLSAFITLLTVRGQTFHSAPARVSA